MNTSQSRDSKEQVYTFNNMLWISLVAIIICVGFTVGAHLYHDGDKNKGVFDHIMNFIVEHAYTLVGIGIFIAVVAVVILIGTATKITSF